MNIDEIQDLIKFVSKSGVSEVEIEQKDFKITIKSDGQKKKKGQKKDQNEGDSYGYFQQQMPMGVPPMQPMPQQMPVQQQPQPQQPSQPSPQQEKKEDSKEKSGNEEKTDTTNTIEVKSPMIGTFYRSSSPDKPPYVKVGDHVEKGDVLCIVEAMKLFNEIESEHTGKVVKVLVEDSSPIEYDQPLFLIEPNG
ncbi:MAG: acetyl-CoA carboxylase biotin carboxyl carrier protein [Flavobacteriales bacterium]